ncbi:DUF2442 domain-containing protein [Caldanaerobius polysaccharolyticus]|uniref:DUF2442 domain-containing protein n=1 Tax=Caldanaerobius polysaccharolyticus TaxID=44256 RepID=UPI0005566B6B|nr:DUF2442 domain-containing protein [Caldanaerobius polysaccharolyticus]
MDPRYFPEVDQVIPTKDFKVYIYFDDGSIKLFDAKDLVKKGVFKKLQDIDTFINTCTVINGTLAWDLKGNFSETDCLDLDPIELYNTCPDVEEPEWLFNKNKQ